MAGLTGSGRRAPDPAAGAGRPATSTPFRRTRLPGKRTRRTGTRDDREAGHRRPT
ncbi:hypothetical protein Ae406Ps2_2953 [Pseudonocardia sp. Ae406_Ps2]|nr:hypothetical protein Ae331Ps2_2973c [Pseudonocardia sp. Ae331_Ps2]OLM02953.1 hypothetical protein Ae406Ps2_2953 [Pseudonocardia sp. Ae406_Ps2]OLM12199.1 hypothetical protein Ae505Ps2_2326c [Pseudonocardia sp. Ae505_Ps2]OLM24531.1 hypothetical protein Ae706Ps2_2964 [Pseudonocardia sp. Ae706_Ps2]